MNSGPDFGEPIATTRVLLVDDEPKLRTSLTAGLRLERWVVVAAATGQQALALIDAERFDLIILDWMLPDADGIDILGKIRPRCPHVPVMMISARNGRSDRAFALEHGAADFLAKPFAFSDLVARCRALLRLG
jgi:DNA-binding response OmpR family regulator